MRKNYAILISTIIVLSFTVARTNMISYDLEKKLAVKDACIKKHTEAKISQEVCELTILCHIDTGRDTLQCLQEAADKVRKEKLLEI